MVKVDQNHTIYAGNKVTLQYTVVDEDNGDAPFDLTANAPIIRWAMSRISGSNYLTAPLFEKTLAAGDIVVSGAGNEIASVTLVGADTGTPANNYVGDFYTELELVDGAGESIVVATGTLTIRSNVVNA